MQRHLVTDAEKLIRHWLKGANYDVGLHVRTDDSRGFESGSIIPLERMFVLGIAEAGGNGPVVSKTRG